MWKSSNFNLKIAKKEKNRENNMQSNLVLSALISRIFGENKNDGIFFYEVLTKNP